MHYQPIGIQNVFSTRAGELILILQGIDTIIATRRIDERRVEDRTRYDVGSVGQKRDTPRDVIIAVVVGAIGDLDRREGVAGGRKLGRTVLDGSEQVVDRIADTRKIVLVGDVEDRGQGDDGGAVRAGNAALGGNLGVEVRQSLGTKVT
ncbi:MAG: hypothetical protein R3E51_10465 [Rhizobiaceae bacterium]